jgi:hypothetical protein
MAGYFVTCDNCDHESHHSNYNRRYILFINGEENEHLSSQTENCYCLYCDSIQRHFMGIPNKGSKLKELELIILKIRNRKPHIILSIFKFIKLLYVNFKIINEKKRTKYSEKILFWAALKSLPRCFNCGNVNEDVMKLINDKSDFSVFIHKCGGKLTLYRRTRSSYVTTHVFHYDVEGKVVSDYTRSRY